MYGNAYSLSEAWTKKGFVLTKALALEIITKMVGVTDKAEVVTSLYGELSDDQAKRLVMLTTFVERYDNPSEAIALVCEYLDCCIL